VVGVNEAGREAALLEVLANLSRARPFERIDEVAELELALVQYPTGNRWSDASSNP
jgi:hypothetical protein